MRDMQAQAYQGGFSNSVFEAQAVFRAVMDAMARPGTIRSLAAGVSAPSPLSATSGAIALTLCDADTPVWLTPALRQSPIPDWLAFHTGAPVKQTKADARFAFVEQGAGLPAFSQFSAGTQDYPDRSTTLIVEVAFLHDGPALVAAGPGIKGQTTLAPKGLPDVFCALWAENRALFPRGIDLVLVAGSDLLCLPRSTALKPKEV